MAPNPKRLLELLQIAKHGAYTRAAAAQGISQPALSNSIAALERSLGVRLLDRTRHGATLTDFGRLLASHAEGLDALLARASEDVRLKKLGMGGSLAVGISPVASVELVPNAIARVKHETPDISVRIYERPDDQLLESLRSGEIDAMVSPAGLLTDPPDVQRETLLRDVAVVIVAPRSPWARQKNYQPGAVARRPMDPARRTYRDVEAYRGAVHCRERALASELRQHEFNCGGQGARHVR